MDKQWDKWKAEQVQTITQILTNVFNVEDEARHMQEPSRLLRRSSLNIPQAEAEIRNKLNQIRKQIIEYEDILELGLKRVDKALEKIDPPKSQSVPTFAKNRSILQKILKFFIASS
jgi:hypothetical protein